MKPDYGPCPVCGSPIDDLLKSPSTEYRGLTALDPCQCIMPHLWRQAAESLGTISCTPYKWDVLYALGKNGSRSIFDVLDQPPITEINDAIVSLNGIIKDGKEAEPVRTGIIESRVNLRMLVDSLMHAVPEDRRSTIVHECWGDIVSYLDSFSNPQERYQLAFLGMEEELGRSFIPRPTDRIRYRGRRRITKETS